MTIPLVSPGILEYIGRVLRYESISLGSGDSEISLLFLGLKVEAKEYKMCKKESR